MILDTAQPVKTEQGTLTFPEPTDSVCLLQIDVQDTVLDVLTVLRSQEKPIFLQLPAEGDAFSCADHFALLGQLLAEKGQPAFIGLVIPPHRTNVVTLAEAYGLPNAPSVDEAVHLFEPRILATEGSASSSFGSAPLESPRDLVTEDQQRVETSFPERMPQGQWIHHPLGKVALLLVISAIVLPLMLLAPTHSMPQASAFAPRGTFSFASSGQFDPALTQGYNDIVHLSLPSMPAPPQGYISVAWLMPDPSDDTTPPLLLGILHQGPINLTYTSPSHTNLLASYSGVRVTVQPATSIPHTPSQDPKMWTWQGFLPQTPTPGDENTYSLLSHVRHLLAKDPTLQANMLPGGLNLWLTRNVSKVEEWASAAQGDWHGIQTSPGDADQIHRQVLRMLEYLDGLFYYQRDVPVGSPWLVDPLAGKIGLLDRIQDQQPPAFLPHVDIHLMGLANSPGHTVQQQELATVIHTVITRMTTDLQQVRMDAALLASMNTQQMRQPGTQEKLDDMANLTSEVKAGWFDNQTGENIGGVLWITSRLQQLASMPVYAQQ